VEVSPEGVDGAPSAEPGEVVPPEATAPVDVPQADAAVETGRVTAIAAEAEADLDAEALTNPEADVFAEAALKADAAAVRDKLSGPGIVVISEDPALALLVDPDTERASGV
jgi:hypothetical protein